ncbi:MAG TPA: tRNA1(Val) (adenine(37)-N6)-methyltransferase [Candidatus Binatia bacterium]|nr:tRNA1(Val) (adenine(37)-N6)-methyltransferase [Candidatus Binatia bacterium]
MQTKTPPSGYFQSLSERGTSVSMIADKKSLAVGRLSRLQKTGETLDALFQGKLKFFQSRGGYRCSLDALLLADFMTCRGGEKIADLGTGNGIVALILAYRHPSVSITGLEIQPTMAERACRNVWMNGFADRVTIRRVDVRNVQQAFDPGSFAAVICNPPYRRTTSGRISPNTERKIARHEIAAALSDFLRAGAHLLPIRGRMALVYPVLHGVDLLKSMRDANLEPKRLRIVHSFADASAALVLAEGVKGGRSGIEVLPPLIVYKQGKQYTAEVEAILAGSVTMY